MVLCDDIIAQGFFSELVRRQGSRIGYMPAPASACATATRRSIFRAATSSTTRSTAARIAELTVKLLLSRLRTGSGEPAVQWLLPAPEKAAAE